MRFQVPQFIDTQTKVIGPFTIRQFMYIATGFVLIIILGYALSTGWAIIISLPIAALSLALAYLKIDGIPLPKYILTAIYFMITSKKYTFKQGQQTSNEIPDEFLK